MKGLRGVIRNRLPESWEHVLRKHKILQKYVELVYISMPPYWKGRQWKNGKLNLSYMYKCPIFETFNRRYLHINPKIDWEEIWKEIKEYENNCK